MTLNVWIGVTFIVVIVVLSVRYGAWNESYLDRILQRMRWMKDANPPLDAILLSRSKRGPH